MRNWLRGAGVATAFCLIAWGLAPPDGGGAHAQGSRARAVRKPNVQAIDVKANQLRETFVRETSDLARQYEEAGDLEKAKEMLQSILAVHPEAPGVSARLEKLDEAILSSNEYEFDIDPSAGWGPPRGRVFQGRAFRVQASGSYRFVASVTVGPEGFPTSEPEKADLAANVPCGALMGVLIDSKGKIGRPFAIAAGREMTPEQDGILFLRLNVPPGSKCTGKVQAQLSGYVLRPQG